MQHQPELSKALFFPNSAGLADGTYYHFVQKSLRETSGQCQGIGLKKCLYYGTSVCVAFYT